MNVIMLSESEKEILNWMWKENKEYSYKEIFQEFGENGNKGWKKQTLSTFLTRMNKKGVISIRKEGAKCYYQITLDKQQYEKKKAEHVLNSYFGGSLNQFMVALTGGETLSEEDADELRKFLED